MTTFKDTHGKDTHGPAGPFRLIAQGTLVLVALVLLGPATGGQEPPLDLERQRTLNRLLSTGFKYFEIQDYAGAIPALKRYTELDSTNADAWYYLATCYLQTKQYPEAIGAFDALNRLDESPETWQNLAFVWDQLGLKEQVITAYERIVELRPEEPEFREYLRRLYQQGGDDRKLLDLEQRTAQLNPDDPLVHARIAELQRRLGDRAAQISSLESAIQADPTNTSNLRTLGRLHLEQNQLEDAARVFDMLTAATPEDAAAWRLLGQTRRRLGDAAGSAAAFGRAVELGAGDVRVFSDMAQSLIDLDRYDEALTWVERAVREQPTDGYAYVTWGDILRAKGFARLEADSTLTYDDKVMLEEAILKYQDGVATGNLSTEVRAYAERQIEALEPFRPTTAEKFMNRARHIPPADH
jgi:tetratricopeptide (TPR) repeat protein